MMKRVESMLGPNWNRLRPVDCERLQIIEIANAPDVRIELVQAASIRVETEGATQVGTPTASGNQQVVEKSWAAPVVLNQKARIEMPEARVIVKVAPVFLIIAVYIK